MVSHILENLPPAKLFRNTMERKKRTSFKSSHQLVEEETCSYLPDDCWEIVFRILIINDNDHCCLNSLSLVSKQFLSVTNCLLFSLTVRYSTRPFLRRLFERFTELSSLDLSNYDYGLNKLLRKISSFSLKITSLNISNNPSNPREHAFPTKGLQEFSRKVTTLTSLNCSYIHSLDSSHFLLIADCFPLLKQLNLSNSFKTEKYSLLSKCRCIQHLYLNNSYFLNDQHVAELSMFLHDLVSINLNSCLRLTKSALFSLIRNCPSLSEIQMEYTNYIGKESVENSDSLMDIGVYPQLKSLYLGHNFWSSDENIIMFASIFPNLQHLVLCWCHRISEGICQVLRRCCKIRYLNLTGCSRVKLLGINFVVPQLEVLNLSDTKVDDETLYVISKNCCGLLKLLLQHCHNIREKGVKHVAENCTLLRELYLTPFLLSDKNKELFSCRGCLVF